MRRLSLPILLACLALAPAALAARPGLGVPTKAALAECHQAADPAQRYAIFLGQMAAVPRAAKMQMRFVVQYRSTANSSFEPVSAPGLDEWIGSQSGVDIFRYRKQVTNLDAPGEYRARVGFRWINAAGRVIMREHRVTAACAVRDPSAASAPL